MRAIYLLAAGVLLLPLSAQAPKPNYGKMKLWSKVGSFALEGEGTVEVTFEGTMLLSGHKGPAPVLTGQIRKEYEGMGRTVWFGSGKIVVQGSWRRLNWFGKNMTALWNGRGMAMVFGEYDSKQELGFAQVDDLPAYPWLNTGRAFYVPKELTPGFDPKAKPDLPSSGPPKPIKGG